MATKSELHNVEAESDGICQQTLKLLIMVV